MTHTWVACYLSGMWHTVVGRVGWDWRGELHGLHGVGGMRWGGLRLDWVCGVGWGGAGWDEKGGNGMGWDGMI